MPHAPPSLWAFPVTAVGENAATVKASPSICRFIRFLSVTYPKGKVTHCNTSEHGLGVPSARLPSAVGISFQDGPRMWRHPAFDGTHYISPRGAPHLSPGCTISHNVVPYVTLLFLLFGRGSRDIAERILYYESQYVVAFAYGVCGSTCAEIEEGDTLPWLLLRFINDEQNGYNACDELISTDVTFYLHERKRDGERCYRPSFTIHTHPKRSSNACVFFEFSQMPFAHLLTLHN